MVHPQEEIVEPHGVVRTRLAETTPEESRSRHKAITIAIGQNCIKASAARAPGMDKSKRRSRRFIKLRFPLCLERICLEPLLEDCRLPQLSGHSSNSAWKHYFAR